MKLAKALDNDSPKVWDKSVAQFKRDLAAAGLTAFESVGGDWYDNSVELHSVANDVRLTEEQQRVMYLHGLSKAYVNHKDGWETHYSWRQGEPFALSKGWRISYPHKRGDDEGFWVEGERPESWPEDWDVRVFPAT